MSSCLSGAGGSRTYGFDLVDIVKPSSAAARPCHSSSPSSTLSESSNSPPRTISIKKARAPRKRPNQTYNEAAALLSTAYPAVFSVKSFKKLPPPFGASFPELPELLPPFPVIGDAAAFLIRAPPPTPDDPSSATAAISIKLKPTSPAAKFSESSPVSIDSAETPNSPAAASSSFDDDFDAESILDEEVGQSIDSIMGNLSMTASAVANAGNTEELSNQSSNISPYLPGLIGFTAGGGGKFDLGLRFRKMQQALRHRDESDWWRTPAVPMPAPAPAPAKGTVPQLKPSLDKKKKKKMEKIETEDLPTNANKTATSKESTKAGLGLRLNHEEIIKAWTGRGSMFSDCGDLPNSSADALARLADIDLSPETGGAGGVREARVQRYKEKRRSRLFSKKIRYQVRKVNAEQRPRMKGRFVSRPSLLQEAIEEGNQ